MAVSPKHRGWTMDRVYGVLGGVYNGALPGASVLGANTALNGVLVGTPVASASPVDSLYFSNTVANGDIAFFALIGGSNSTEIIRIDTSAGALLINDGSVDLDLRVETNNMQYALYLDGGKDALVLGSNTDTSSADQLITVSRAARSNTSGTSYYDFIVAPAGAVTTAGTTAIVASVRLNEPNITVGGGSVTNATTLCIGSQPTEGGTTNSAIYFAAAANIAGTTSLTFNDDSADIDFRFESNGMAYAIYSDGAKDALVLGSNTDTSSADQLITISRAARTATATVNYYDLIIAPAGAVTVPTGATTLVASARFNEPNITLTGTLTAATTVYIADAPSEASSNYALWIDTGTLRLDGNLDLGDAAVDVLVKAATAAALEISDGTTKFYAFDTRVAVAGVTTHALDISDYTIASGATNVETGLSLAAHTLNYTGTTQVTTQVDTIVIGARTIAGDTATLTVDEANTLLLVAPTEGTNVTLTAASALRILDAAGTPTNQYGIYVEAQSGGTTQNYAIYSAGGRNELVNSFTGDNRILKLSGTATNIALTDGYGALEVDLTLAGTLASHSAASSTWVNITTGTVGAGNYICAHNDGIYEATAATITNALLIFGSRMHYLADDTDGLCFPFSLNTNNTAITAVFDCQNLSDFGTVANAGSGTATLLPILRTSGGTKKYVLLYDLA